MAFKAQNLVDLIHLAMKHNASDIHIRTDEVPALRILGELIPIQTRPFSEQDIRDICGLLIKDQEILDRLDTINELDGSYSVEDFCRLRINLFRYMGKLGLIFRVLKMKVPTIDELNLPSTLKKIAEIPRGLVLVTGPTGSGKTTTLAAMIQHLNQTKSVHILTLEDPVEFIHTSQKARISQREIGQDTENFSQAFRAALRQDPDVILVGELRDAETISTAMKAAETGHTVFATLHTTNAIATVNRIIAMFPSSEQEEVRKRLAESLYATIGQRILKKKNASGLAVAMEIMIKTINIRDCILGKEPLERIPEFIAKGKTQGGNGSRTFDQHLLDLLQARVISQDEAIEAAESPGDLMQKLTFT